ncbi:hypothetical protein ALI22I_26395 [Saccharothrix sp. ALI-22-I]|uniref:DUF3626 domain-containing protein n=1 Tax=Saccharothrix sp. ALI-22-I TaxID=1933778 RepID=UPI00097C36DB|nr:DUF3626 domain-containing protein [Saccharothrix sp. ALI-22-I]ONI86227.1 hypothetical protein ALI22I_26395 [Saccharothrix sp. ALI-22-I]
MSGPELSGAEHALRHVEARSTGSPLDRALRVTLNFHPERVVAALADTGRYVSQFVTGTSNGGLTAFAGGDRWRWESRMFGGVYDRASAYDRPVYGGLNFRLSPYGASPRFGSAHLRLTADTLSRTTFCYPDSFLEPENLGTADRMALIEIALADDRDLLDDYIEAHVHGPVSVEADAEALVLDPSYRGTAVEEEASRLPCAVEWHPGFRLSVDELRRHPDFRGPQYVDLGLEIAVDGVLTPKIIGDVRDRYDQQDLKKVWHLLARFGRP